jgi:hypothetical protein
MTSVCCRTLPVCLLAYFHNPTKIRLVEVPLLPCLEKGKKNTKIPKSKTRLHHLRVPLFFINLCFLYISCNFIQIIFMDIFFNVSLNFNKTTGANFFFLRYINYNIFVKKPLAVRWGWTRKLKIIEIFFYACFSYGAPDFFGGHILFSHLAVDSISYTNCPLGRVLQCMSWVLSGFIWFLYFPYPWKNYAFHLRSK